MGFDVNPYKFISNNAIVSTVIFNNNTDKNIFISFLTFYLTSTKKIN